MSTPEFAKVEIGGTGEFLDGVVVDTPAGESLFRETQVAADPVEAEALARVKNQEPPPGDYGLVVRAVGVNERLQQIEDAVRAIVPAAGADVLNIPDTQFASLFADFISNLYLLGDSDALIKSEAAFVVNQPSVYPLPSDQVQTDALTRAELDAAPVVVDTGLTQPTTPADTQPVSAESLPLPAGAATEAKQLPDNHQVTVSNQPSEFPLPAAQVAALAAPAVQPVSGAVTANQGTTPWIVADPSAFNLLNRTPPAAGAYGYSAGVSGTVNVAASRRVLMFTCVAGVSGATVTINGGDAIAVPANRPLTIEPRGNLVAPTIVFSGTVTYFVEHVL